VTRSLFQKIAKNDRQKMNGAKKFYVKISTYVLVLNILGNFRNFQKTAQRKLSPNRRKIAPSGHPGAYSCMALKGRY
jgi:hypothetical protein